MQVKPLTPVSRSAAISCSEQINRLIINYPKKLSKNKQYPIIKLTNSQVPLSNIPLLSLYSPNDNQ